MAAVALLLACLLLVGAVGGIRVLSKGFLVLMEVLIMFRFVKDLIFGDIEDIDSFLEIESRRCSSGASSSWRWPCRP